MILRRYAREYLDVTITTDPAAPVDAVWEATFDGGETWVAWEPVDGEPDRGRWLIAGPDAEMGDAVARLPEGSSCVPFRLAGAPEIVGPEPAATVLVVPNRHKGA